MIHEIKGNAPLVAPQSITRAAHYVVAATSEERTHGRADQPHALFT
jgi:hypothetical protein